MSLDDLTVRSSISEIREEVTAMSKLMVKQRGIIDTHELNLRVLLALNLLLSGIVLYKVW
jgi:hypothetical protein